MFVRVSPTDFTACFAFLRSTCTVQLFVYVRVGFCTILTASGQVLGQAVKGSACCLTLYIVLSIQTALSAI